MRILITGGAGYIGSNTSRLFHERGYKIEVLDNLSTGNDWAIKHFKHHNGMWEGHGSNKGKKQAVEMFFVFEN